MSASGWEQLLFIVAVTAVLAPLLGRYLAATFRGSSTTPHSATPHTATPHSATPHGAPGDRVFLPVERLVYRALQHRPREQLDLAGLRAGGAGVRARFHPAAVPHPAAAGVAAAEPDPRPGDVPAAVLQHRHQLHHRHELAGLRGRDGGQLPRPDGRAGGRAVHRGRHRAVGGPGRRPRHRRIRAHDRQLLGGSDPEPGARLRPAVGPRRAGAGEPGRGPELQRLPHGHDAGRRDPADSRRPGQLDGGHQAARHQRRQLLRRRRRPPVREPHRLHQHVRPAAGHRAAVRHRPHVRPAHRPAAAGLRHRGGHGHHLPGPHRGLDAGRGARQPSASGDRVPGGDRRQPRRVPGGQGDAVRRRPGPR